MNRWSFFCITSLIIFSSARGQALVVAHWPSETPVISFHAQATDFRSGSAFIFPSGAIETTAQFPLSSRFFGFAGIPIGMQSREGANGSHTWRSSGAIIGNITIGAGHRTIVADRIALANSVMVLLNSTPSSDICDCETYWARYAAWYADPYRAERFIQRYWTLQTNTQASFRIHSSAGLFGELRPQLLLPDGAWGHSEFWLNAGAVLWFGSARVQGVAEYVLSGWLSGGGSSPGANQYYDALGIGIRATFQQAEPALYYQFALDRHMRRTIDGHWGFRVSIPLRTNR